MSPSDHHEGVQASEWQPPSWKELVAGCEVIEGLSDFDRERARRAFAVLEESFGSDFPSSAVKSKHPLGMTLINQAPWTRKWLTWLADAIESSRECEGYGELSARLTDPSRYREAISVLRLGDRMRRAGWKIGFDRAVVVRTSEKLPDLVVDDAAGGPPLFVEVTSLAESHAARNASMTSWAVQSELFRSAPFLSYCGIIRKSLSEPHLAEVAGLVRQTVERSSSSRAFHRLEIPGVLAIGVAPDTDLELLEAWGEEAGVKVGTLDGPPFDSDEVVRTRRAIEREQKQLPTSQPGILVIENAFMFHWIRDFERVVGELEEEVYKFPQVLAVVVAGTHAGVDDAGGRMFGHHAYFRHRSHELVVENFLVMLNRFCKFELPASRLARVYAAFASGVD